MSRRIHRLSSLLKEVISEVLRTEVKNPSISPLTTVTHVEVTKDLEQAKVYISVLGEKEDRLNTLRALKSASGFIGSKASKKVTLRHFPTLTIHLDESVDHQIHIEKILKDIKNDESN